jgi:FkbM family methyltransferase
LLFQPRIVSGSYSGVELALELRDPLAMECYGQGWPPLPEIELLRQHRLMEGARVFDIGAHQGVVALILARIAGPDGSVIAVEANPHNAAATRRNRDLNKAKNLIVVEGPVAETSGRVLFNLGLNGQVDRGTGEWGRLEVPAVTVDDLARNYAPPTVLFIDIEGYESRALSGATQTLLHRPDCFVEVHVQAGLEDIGGSLEQVIAHFPHDRFQRFAAPPGGAFTEFRDGLPFLCSRFFLIALGR